MIRALLDTDFNAIVTRNLADYASATIAVYSPTDFLALLSATNTTNGTE